MKEKVRPAKCQDTTRQAMVGWSWKMEVKRQKTREEEAGGKERGNDEKGAEAQPQGEWTARAG